MALRPDMVSAPSYTSDYTSYTDTTPGAFPTTANESAITSTPHSLSQAVKARRTEYTRREKIRIKIGSWNVASVSGTEKDVVGWFIEGKGISEVLSGLVLEDGQGSDNKHTIEAAESVEQQEQRRTKKESTIPKDDPAPLPALEEIGIYVLGLQEIVDVSSPSEALRPFTDPTAAKKWKVAVEEGLPDGYQLVAEQQLIGLFLLIYVSPSIAPSIRSCNTTSVGTGLMGYMGNKGAVTARLILGETTKMMFINCHLAAGADKAALERRNWDAGQILSRTRFPPVSDGEQVIEEFGDKIGDEDFAFWFGDLNYRLDDIPGDDVRRLLLLHTRNEYDINVKSKQKIDDELSNSTATTTSKELSSNRSSTDSPAPSTKASSLAPIDQSNKKSSESSSLLLLDDVPPDSDPASLQTTLSSLLPHDQLQQQMRQRKAFHDGWREGDIRFLPTYKYDIGSVGMFDTSEKKRSPSWCDRILYRTRHDRIDYEKRREDEETARKKDEEMKARGIDESAADDVLFDYDPETDGGDDDNDYDEYENTEDDAGVELIMTREGFEDSISLDHYTSHQRVLSSDHKPLDAIFTLVYDAIVPELKQRVHQEVARELDRAENEGRPGVTIVVDSPRDESAADENEKKGDSGADFQGVNFGNVRYDVPKSRSMTIANTGRVAATFCFIDRPVEKGKPKGVCPPWITVMVDRPSDNDNPNPSALREYTLQPGDTVNVQLEININNINHVADLNEALADLDDVLVLRVNDGRDHFVPLRGSWLQSCFGRSLEELTRAPDGGVREAQTKVPLPPNSPKSPKKESQVRFSAPRELYRLTEGIEELVERTMAEWGMTNPLSSNKPPWESHSGWPFTKASFTLDAETLAPLCASVREALDTNAPLTKHFPPETPSLHRLEALSATLLLFLHSLTDGIITKSIWTTIESHVLSLEKAKKPLPATDASQSFVLEALSSSPAHSVSFTFLTFMLARLAAELAPLPTPPRRSQIAKDDSSSTAESTPRQSQDETQPPISAPASPAPTRTSRARSISRVLAPITPTSFSPTSFSPISSLTGRTTTVDPAKKKRQEVEKEFSAVFGEAIVRASPPVRERERKAFEDRRAWVVKMFVSQPEA